LETFNVKKSNRNYEPSNCRWVNDNTQASNQRVLRKDNSSGFRGVHLEKSTNKYKCRIQIDKKRIIIGTFTDKQEAAKAYNDYIDLHNLEHTKNIL